MMSYKKEVFSIKESESNVRVEVLGRITSRRKFEKVSKVRSRKTQEIIIFDDDA